MIYNTEKRKEITSLVSKNADRALSIDEICGAVAPDGHGKSTVYRIVSAMVDEGVLSRMSDGETRRVTYRYVGDTRCYEHLHLKCKGCGRLIHLDEETSHALEDTIRAARRFEIDIGATIQGRCEACAAGGVKI